MPEEIAPVKSIDDAIKLSHTQLNEDGSLKSVEKTEPEKKIEPKVETKPETEELTEEEVTLAKNLLKGLKNPETAPSVVDFLAKQHGYTKAEIKELKENLEDGSKKEKVEAADEIMDLFKDQFGEEFAAKLAPAIKKAITKGVEESVKPIHQSFEQQELTKLQTESNSALTEIAGKFYDNKEFPKEVLNEMDRLMDVYKPSKSQSLEEYLSDIHALAAAKKGGSLKPVDSKKQERIENNRKDIPGRLRSGGTPSSENSDLPPAKNLDEAIRRAEAQLSKAS